MPGLSKSSLGGLFRKWTITRGALVLEESGLTRSFSTIEAAVAAFARGEMIIVVDAEDRENEGDFVCAAEKVTPEIVNFMLKHGRGQVCVPVLPDVCERLKLTPM